MNTIFPKYLELCSSNLDEAIIDTFSGSNSLSISLTKAVKLSSDNLSSVALNIFIGILHLTE